jgi:hypothetical protein
MGDLMGAGGGDDVLSGLEGVDDGGAADAAAEQADSGADQVANQATAAAAALDGADGLLNDSFGDQLDTLERGMDDLEDQTEGMDDANNTSTSNHNSAAPAGPSAAAVGVAVAEGAVLGTYLVGGGPSQAQDGNKARGAHNQDGQSQGDIVVEEEPEAKKAGRFGWVGNLGSAIATAAKESVAGAILGDGLAEMLVEKQEEKADERREEKERSKRDLQASMTDLHQSSTSVSGGSKRDLNQSPGGPKR